MGHLFRFLGWKVTYLEVLVIFCNLKCSNNAVVLQIIHVILIHFHTFHLNVFLKNLSFSTRMNDNTMLDLKFNEFVLALHFLIQSIFTLFYAYFMTQF